MYSTLHEQDMLNIQILYNWKSLSILKKCILYKDSQKIPVWKNIVLDTLMEMVTWKVRTHTLTVRKCNNPCHLLVSRYTGCFRRNSKYFRRQYHGLFRV